VVGDDIKGWFTMFPDANPNIRDISTTPNRLIKANMSTQVRALSATYRLLMLQAAKFVHIGFVACQCLNNQPGRQLDASNEAPND
jgi:hypothetical protein